MMRIRFRKRESQNLSVRQTTLLLADRSHTLPGVWQ
jgi:hypothetical protein